MRLCTNLIKTLKDNEKNYKIHDTPPPPPSLDLKVPLGYLGHLVLTTLMVLTWAHCIEFLILNHTHTRGVSVSRMQGFYRTC